MKKKEIIDKILQYHPNIEHYHGCDEYKSGFAERFPELSLFFKAFSLLNSEMICIFPYFCPCEIIVREIREISFSHCLPPCREALLNHA
ncbi:MAG: hypothetical protein ACLR3N_00605 [Agathobacter rectalis]